MKILWLSNIPSPYRVDFFNELGQYCDLTVLYEREKANNRKWTRHADNYYKSILLRGIKIGNDTALCFDIIKYLKDEKYDTIIIGGYSTPTGMLAIEYLKLKRKNFILNCDGGFIRENENKIQYFIKKHFISAGTYYLSSGNETNKYLIYYGAKKESIFVYPFTSLCKQDILNNPKTYIEKDAIKVRKNIIGKQIVICVGQIIKRKGIDTLLKASINFSTDVHTYIIGGKPTEEYLSIINKYNLKNVHFVDFLEKCDLYLYLQASDVFVFPTREDIWGLVINEAMANGLPIITTKKCIAGIELVKGNGYIINCDDVDALSTSVNEILSETDIYYDYSLKSLENIKIYTKENMAYVIYCIVRGIYEKKR